MGTVTPSKVLPILGVAKDSLLPYLSEMGQLHHFLTATKDLVTATTRLVAGEKFYYWQGQFF